MNFISKFFLFTILSFSALNLFGQDNQKYASLAIDQRDGDNYGWAVEYESQSEANKRAKTECEEYGNDCTVVLQFNGGCGAYVVERGNSSLYGWGVADTRMEAERIAMNEAREQGGTDLVVRVWGCNSDNLIDSKYTAPSLKGVYGFYFMQSEREKKCFISEIYYQPNVAQKVSSGWKWTDNAESIMTPMGDAFLDVIEDNLYGFLGEELRKKVIEGRVVDWKGLNEVDQDNASLSLRSNVERRQKLEKTITEIRGIMKNNGFEIIDVPLSDLK